MKTAVKFLALAGVGFGAADARADAVQMWNAEMLSIIRQTSPLIVDGPPEVAREIAILGTAMSDAARATTSGAWLPYAYTGGAASGASTEAAVLADTVHVMSQRPGRIVHTRGVALARPRNVFAPEFVDIVHELRDRIGLVRAAA